MIKIDNIKLSPSFTSDDLINKACQKLNITKDLILSVKILRKSIDARKEVVFALTLGVSLKNNLEKQFPELNFQKDTSLLAYDKKHTKLNPVVVGFGPSGMFSALMLARMGLNPIIIEQGKQVDERESDIVEFWKNGKINPHSNVQFGEGGAGTFSDGKLNTNLSNKYCKKIINEFVHFGAPEEILIDNKPHIGSDKLKTVVQNFRKEIIRLGGKFLFSHKFISFTQSDKKLTFITVKDLIKNEEFEIETDRAILALGHSAKDTFKMLYEKEVFLQQKPFAMGVRIEQKQQDLNVIQYGKNYDKNLPSADYKLAVHLPDGRSVFTFCMCPGGYVVASASAEGEVVTNGMSLYNRDNEFCNSALLVNVLPSDFGSEHPLAGLEFQAKYEKLAFELGGKNYHAPAQSVGSFVYNKKENPNIRCSYQPNIKFTQIEKCLPDFIAKALKEGIPLLNKKMPNFTKEDNLLIAIESRSSCPLTIVRDENFQSSIKGIYPAGEGAGYAGGIMSSAVDGIKIAEQIYSELV